MTDERLTQVKAQIVQACYARRRVTLDSWEMMQLVMELERRRAEERAQGQSQTTAKA